MTVTFTPNLNLAKPDISELARNWADLDELQRDNNVEINAALPNDTDYAASLVTDATPPSVGSGAGAVEYGRYILMPGDFIMGWFVFRFDSPGVSAGTGTAYAVSLPFPCDTAFHSEGTTFGSISGGNDVIGEAFLRDSDSATLSQSCAMDLIHVSGVSYARFNTEAYTGKTSRFFAPGQPFTLADEDMISGNFFYKAVIP